MTICIACGADRDILKDALASESNEDRVAAVIILEGCEDCLAVVRAIAEGLVRDTQR